MSEVIFLKEQVAYNRQRRVTLDKGVSETISGDGIEQCPEEDGQLCVEVSEN